MAAEMVITGWNWAGMVLIVAGGFLLGLSVGLRWTDASE
jgi:hypothetical protein